MTTSRWSFAQAATTAARILVNGYPLVNAVVPCISFVTRVLGAIMCMILSNHVTAATIKPNHVPILSEARRLFLYG
jgi:hypothetical protein